MAFKGLLLKVAGWADFDLLRRPAIPNYLGGRDHVKSPLKHKGLGQTFLYYFKLTNR
jgi:hypothetical protein